jgi:hypothetical protein
MYYLRLRDTYESNADASFLEKKNIRNNLFLFCFPFFRSLNGWLAFPGASIRDDTPLESSYISRFR